MSDFRYEIKTSLPAIWLENIDTKNPGWSVRNERTMTKLILVDPVEDEDSSTDWSSKLLTMRSKENKEYYSLIRSIDHHFTLHWLWQIFLMWSQINVLLSIRLTGGQQIDFKVFKFLL